MSGRRAVFRRRNGGSGPNVEAEERLADRPPVRFGSASQVRNSLISAGCDIRGTVINSVLSPGVVIEKGAVVIEPRGDLLDKNNIQERLTMRNFMEGLRNSGVETGGPPALSAADRQSFANQLDRLLARRK